jgi:hypothetical protein
LQVDGRGSGAEHDVLSERSVVPEGLHRGLPALDGGHLVEQQQAAAGRAARSFARPIVSASALMSWRDKSKRGRSGEAVELIDLVRGFESDLVGSES